MRMNRNFKIKLVLLLLMLSIISCVPIKKLSYFNDINVIEGPVVNPRTQKTIMPFDRIYIKVLSTDAQTSQIFNPTEELRTSGTGTSLLGYLVDESGNITFPFAGKINVGSMTTSEAEIKIQKSLSEYVPNTSVTSVSVKFIDNKVSVLGEVTNQGVYTFPQDKLNIYEALAFGGGITRYGNRKNVVLIRQEGGKIAYHKLDLSDTKIASKDYFYVLPNDVIVVEPLKSLSTSYQNNTYTTILTSITTLLAVLLFMGYKL